MIKQTASYGVWTVNRHDDGKIEVLKNGIVCEKAKPALREIAEEIGFEINPDWTSQQLGQKKPNELGLYDMSGNVWECCRDFYKEKLGQDPVIDPVEEKGDKDAHVSKGGTAGGYYDGGRDEHLRCQRNNNYCGYVSFRPEEFFGFRLAL